MRGYRPLKNDVFSGFWLRDIDHWPLGQMLWMVTQDVMTAHLLVACASKSNNKWRIERVPRYSTLQTNTNTTLTWRTSLPIASWDPREIWRQYGRENSAYNWIWDNYRCYMCYLKVHLSAHASWPVYYSTHEDLESPRGGNVRKFARLFFTLITIKCRSTWINSILRIFGMYFNLKFNSLKQIKCEKDLKSE